MSFVVGNTHTEIDALYNSSVLGYHECLAYQLQLVAGEYFPGRSAWPSAVPHTSYGDSIPAVAAGLAILADELSGFDSKPHQVSCKHEATQRSKINESGLRALSCNWRLENGERKRDFLNYTKLKYSLPYNFSVEGAIGKYGVITDPDEKRDYLDILQRVEDSGKEEYKGIVKKVSKRVPPRLRARTRFLNGSGEWREGELKSPLWATENC